MRLVVRGSTGTVVHRTPLTIMAGQMVMPSPEAAITTAAQATGLDPAELISWPAPDRQTAEALLLADLASLVATIEGGEVVGVTINPDYTPPAPAPDPVQALRADVAHLKQVVATTIPSSPHDRRYLTDKEIGKMLIPWLKANPSATVQQATNYVVPLILAELPGQPVIPPLYWEWIDPATQEVHSFGLGMSYLYEARVRGYCPPETPLTWEALVSLVVATPEEQIAAWLRSL